jgi:hypothetical protein
MMTGRKVGNIVRADLMFDSYPAQPATGHLLKMRQRSRVEPFYLSFLRPSKGNSDVFLFSATLSRRENNIGGECYEIINTKNEIKRRRTTAIAQTHIAACHGVVGRW